MKLLPILFLVVLPLCHAAPVNILTREEIGIARHSLSKEADGLIDSLVRKRFEEFGSSVIWDGPFSPEQARIKTFVGKSDKWKEFANSKDPEDCYILYQTAYANVDPPIDGDPFVAIEIFKISLNNILVTFGSLEKHNQSAHTTPASAPR